MPLFEKVLDNHSKIFENVPKGKEGEANKETKGASDVRNQRDNVVGDHLMIIGQNVAWCCITYILRLFIMHFLRGRRVLEHKITWICSAFTSVLTETEIEA